MVCATGTSFPDKRVGSTSMFHEKHIAELFAAFVFFFVPLSLAAVICHRRPAHVFCCVAAPLFCFCSLLLCCLGLLPGSAAVLLLCFLALLLLAFCCLALLLRCAWALLPCCRCQLEAPLSSIEALKSWCLSRGLPRGFAEPSAAFRGCLRKASLNGGFVCQCKTVALSWLILFCGACASFQAAPKAHHSDLSAPWTG